jgi:dual specificity phosphatase 12
MASQVLSYLYLGGKMDAKSTKTLENLNIKYILNCTPKRKDDPETGCPNFYEKDKKKSLVYKRIPIFDNKGEDLLPYMETSFNFIEEGKHYGNVLVHCHRGISRSASFVIGYLMRKNELTFKEALEHVQGCRKIVQPNAAFITQLTNYNPYNPSIVSEESTSVNIVSIGPSAKETTLIINDLNNVVEVKKLLVNDKDDEANAALKCTDDNCYDFKISINEDLPISKKQKI